MFRLLKDVYSAHDLQLTVESLPQGLEQAYDYDSIADEHSS